MVVEEMGVSALFLALLLWFSHSVLGLFLSY